MLTLLSVAGMLVYPAVSKMLDQAKLRAAAREVANVFKEARVKSEYEQRVVGVHVDLESGKIRVAFQSGKEVCHYDLWEKASFEKFLVDGRQVEGSSSVWFYPDGRSAEVAVVLRQPPGRRMYLLTDSLTGVMHVLQPGDKRVDSEVFR